MDTEINCCLCDGNAQRCGRARKGCACECGACVCWELCRQADGQSTAVEGERPIHSGAAEPTQRQRVDRRAQLHAEMQHPPARSITPSDDNTRRWAEEIEQLFDNEEKNEKKKEKRKHGSEIGVRAGKPKISLEGVFNSCKMTIIVI